MATAKEPTEPKAASDGTTAEAMAKRLRESHGMLILTKSQRST